MLFAGKDRQKPAQAREEKSLYPIAHVAGSLKAYQKELVQKEVTSLWELSMVGSAFSSVLSDAEHFHSKLLELGNSFSNINETAEQFAQVRGTFYQIFFFNHFNRSKSGGTGHPISAVGRRS